MIYYLIIHLICAVLAIKIQAKATGRMDLYELTYNLMFGWLALIAMIHIYGSEIFIYKRKDKK